MTRISRKNALIRAATFEDYAEAVHVLDQLGLKVPTTPDSTQQMVEMLWCSNPARPRMGRLSPGWVVEADGRIVGFFGNMLMRYQIGQQTLLAGAGTQLGVLASYRDHTNALAAAYFNQPGVDLILGTTTNEASGRVYSRFGCHPLPQSDYQQINYWILDAAAFIKVIILRKLQQQRLARLSSSLLHPFLAAFIAARSGNGRDRLPGKAHSSLPVEAVALMNVGGEFDELWQRNAGQDGRLLACRTAVDLRWHFRHSAEANALTMLACRRNGRLEGYLALIRETLTDLKLVRAKIADMFVAGDEATVIESLLAGAAEAARSQGCHLLEFQGFPAPVREQVLRHRPFTRHAPAFPFYYKACSPMLDDQLRSAAAWYPTPYDGDSTLIYYPAL